MKTVPKFNELMWPALKAIKELGGSGNITEIVDKVIELENIPEEIQNIPHTKGPMSRLEYNLAWARHYLKKAGALDNSERGVYALTDEGDKFTASDIPQLVNKVRQDPSKKQKNESSNPVEGIDSEEAQALDWKYELLEFVQTKLSPSQFERLTQRILRESGFTEVDVTGKSGDGGIDGFGILKLGLLSFKVIFQCKRYKGSVGPSEIRDFRGAMQGRAEKGLFVTTGSFTRAAKEEARRDGAPPVDLIDGDELCNILKSLKLGVETQVQEVTRTNQKWLEAI